MNKKALMENFVVIALLTKNGDSFATVFGEAFKQAGIETSFIYPHTGNTVEALAKIRPHQPGLIIVDTASLGDMSDFLTEIKKEFSGTIWSHSGHPLNMGAIHIANEKVLQEEIVKLKLN